MVLVISFSLKNSTVTLTVQFLSVIFLTSRTRLSYSPYGYVFSLISNFSSFVVLSGVSISGGLVVLASSTLPQETKADTHKITSISNVNILLIISLFLQGRDSFFIKCYLEKGSFSTLFTITITLAPSLISSGQTSSPFGAVISLPVLGSLTL